MPWEGLLIEFKAEVASKALPFLASIFYTFKHGGTDMEPVSSLGPVLLTDVFCMTFTFPGSTTVFTLLPKLKHRAILTIWIFDFSWTCRGSGHLGLAFPGDGH